MSDKYEANDCDIWKDGFSVAMSDKPKIVAKLVIESKRYHDAFWSIGDGHVACEKYESCDMCEAIRDADNVVGELGKEEPTDE